MHVCECEGEREGVYPWKPLGCSFCQADLGVSPHLQDLDVFCPLRDSLRLANPAELPAASLQDAVQTRILMEITAEKNSFGRGREMPGREVRHPGGSLPSMVPKHMFGSRMRSSRLFQDCLDLV